MTTPAEHAATVRQFRRHLTIEDCDIFDPALDALVALAERATELERERDEVRREMWGDRGRWLDDRRRAEQLERERDEAKGMYAASADRMVAEILQREEAEELERERDGLAEALREYGGKPGGLLRIITAKDAAEARVEQLEAALRRIRDEQVAVTTHSGVTHTSRHGHAAVQIARAVLDGGTT